MEKKQNWNTESLVFDQAKTEEHINLFVFAKNYEEEYSEKKRTVIDSSIQRKKSKCFQKMKPQEEVRKTEQEIKESSREELNPVERMVQSMMKHHNMTFETAMDALDELP